MVARSALVDVRPFRTGLLVTTFGLLAMLGAAHGGAAGAGLGTIIGVLLGSTGTTILGALTLVIGALLLSGASAGALVRRSGHAVKRAHTKARQARQPELTAPTATVVPLRPAEPPVDAVHDFPDVVGESQPPPLLVQPEPEHEPDTPSLFDVTTEPTNEEYQLPDRGLLRQSPPAKDTGGDVTGRTAAALVETLAHFGVQATIVGQISGPRVTRYELQLAPGTKVSKVAALKDDLSYALATTEIRILAPIPGKQAVGVELPNLSPNLVTLGDIFDDLPVDREPARRLARQGHLRHRRLDRPRADAARPDRRHHRLGQVRLHQHAPDVDPAALDAGRGADDPDRPEADRAQLLRVDPASADARRVEPEAGGRCARERRGRDGAALRAAVDPARQEPPRGEPLAPPARRAGAPVPARRDRRARRPDDDLAAGGRGRRHPAGAEVARGRDPPRPRDAAAVRGRDHRDDQGERPLPDRLRGLQPDRLTRDPRPGRRREPSRPGRHALQAARHLSAAARPGRLRGRGGDRPRRRAVPRTSASRSSTSPSSSCPRSSKRTSTPRTASSTPTRTRCSTRRSRSSSRRRRPRSRCCSAASASATRAPDA